MFASTTDPIAHRAVRSVGEASAEQYMTNSPLNLPTAPHIVDMYSRAAITWFANHGIRGINPQQVADLTSFVLSPAFEQWHLARVGETAAVRAVCDLALMVRADEWSGSDEDFASCSTVDLYRRIQRTAVLNAGGVDAAAEVLSEARQCFDESNPAPTKPSHKDVFFDAVTQLGPESVIWPPIETWAAWLRSFHASLVGRIVGKAGVREFEVQESWSLTSWQNQFTGEPNGDDHFVFRRVCEEMVLQVSPPFHVHLEAAGSMDPSGNRTARAIPLQPVEIVIEAWASRLEYVCCLRGYNMRDLAGVESDAAVNYLMREAPFPRGDPEGLQRAFVRFCVDPANDGTVRQQWKQRILHLLRENRKVMPLHHSVELATRLDAAEEVTSAATSKARNTSEAKGFSSDEGEELQQGLAGNERDAGSIRYRAALEKVVADIKTAWRESFRGEFAKRLGRNHVTRQYWGNIVNFAIQLGFKGGNEVDFNATRKWLTEREESLAGRDPAGTTVPDIATVRGWKRKLQHFYESRGIKKPRSEIKEVLGLSEYTTEGWKILMAKLEQKYDGTKLEMMRRGQQGGSGAAKPIRTEEKAAPVTEETRERWATNYRAFFHKEAKVSKSDSAIRDLAERTESELHHKFMIHTFRELVQESKHQRSKQQDGGVVASSPTTSGVSKRQLSSAERWSLVKQWREVFRAYYEEKGVKRTPDELDHVVVMANFTVDGCKDAMARIKAKYEKSANGEPEPATPKQESLQKTKTAWYTAYEAFYREHGIDKSPSDIQAIVDRTRNEKQHKIILDKLLKKYATTETDVVEEERREAWMERYRAFYRMRNMYRTDGEIVAMMDRTDGSDKHLRSVLEKMKAHYGPPTSDGYAANLSAESEAARQRTLSELELMGSPPCGPLTYMQSWGLRAIKVACGVDDEKSSPTSDVNEQGTEVVAGNPAHPKVVSVSATRLSIPDAERLLTTVLQDKQGLRDIITLENIISIIRRYPQLFTLSTYDGLYPLQWWCLIKRYVLTTARVFTENETDQLLLRAHQIDEVDIAVPEADEEDADELGVSMSPSRQVRKSIAFLEGRTPTKVVRYLPTEPSSAPRSVEQRLMSTGGASSGFDADDDAYDVEFARDSTRGYLALYRSLISRFGRQRREVLSDSCKYSVVPRDRASYKTELRHYLIAIDVWLPDWKITALLDDAAAGVDNGPFSMLELGRYEQMMSDLVDQFGPVDVQALDSAMDLLGKQSNVAYWRRRLVTFFKAKGLKKTTREMKAMIRRGEEKGFLVLWEALAKKYGREGEDPQGITNSAKVRDDDRTGVKRTLGRTKSLSPELRPAGNEHDDTWRDSSLDAFVSQRNQHKDRMRARICARCVELFGPDTEEEVKRQVDYCETLSLPYTTIWSRVLRSMAAQQRRRTACGDGSWQLYPVYTDAQLESLERDDILRACEKEFDSMATPINSSDVGRSPSPAARLNAGNDLRASRRALSPREISL